MTREQVIERIKKLLAHSVENGATEAEAISFALKAQKLIAEYDVQEYELGDTHEQVVVEVGCEKTQSRNWKSTLSKVVADNFRCQRYKSYRYKPGKMKRESFIVFVGYEYDAKAALMVFENLYEVGNRLAKEYAKEHDGDKRVLYDSFVEGFIEGVRLELEKQCQALMLVRPKEVDDYVAENLNLRHRTFYTRAVRDSSFDNGVSAGKKTVRSKRVESSSGSYALGAA